MRLTYLLKSLADLFSPACCPVCGRHLSDGEKGLCLQCHLEMPRLRFSADGKMPEVEQLFTGCQIVTHAVSCFAYSRQSRYAEILKDLKYHHAPQAALHIARGFAEELKERGYFDGVDEIIPVPLHRSKLKKRGYNQSLLIARVLAEVAQIPVGEGLKAVKPHATQTAKDTEERHRNVGDVFRASHMEGRHVLLVDDVITTGATLTACCDALQAAGAASVRIVSLAFAGALNY